ncbi:MAG: hypothetical protein HWE30_19500 [Methylocystaceae bacterium]|nr:hypothetical protein [Methylocystaceae bacterium]
MKNNPPINAPTGAFQYDYSNIAIKLVDALAGAGKTYNACKWAVERASAGQKVMIVQPSIKLLQQTEADLKPMIKASGQHVPLRRFDTDALDGQSVTKSVMTFLKDYPQGRSVIAMMTHQAFDLLPYFHRAQDWVVIYDELPVVDMDLTMRVPRSHNMFMGYVQPVDQSDDYCKLIARENNGLRKFTRGDDDVYQPLQSFAHKMLDEHWNVYAIKLNYHDVVIGNDLEKKTKLSLFAILKPTKFKDFRETVIMGACAMESVMYRLWSSWGVRFEEHSEIMAGLQYHQHNNGNRLNVHYFSDEAWSKNLRDKTMEESDTTVMDGMLSELMVRLKDQEFLWVANNDVEDNVFADCEGATRLSNISHGLNSYQHIDHVAFLSALNRTPAHFKFLQAQGINAGELRDALVHQTTYQSVMRCSLRNPNANHPVNVYVTDMITAEWLGNIFPGSAVSCFAPEGFAFPEQKQRGRPAQHENAAERQKAYRQRLKMEQTALKNVNAQLTVLADLYDTKGEIYDVSAVDGLINQLHEAWQTTYAKKKDNHLVSSAVFNPALSEKTNRGLKNVENTWGIWLDNDDPNGISWQDFKKVFAHFKMVGCNSHSGNGRYRVFLPTTTVMTTEVHQIVIDHIFLTLTDHGYEHHGFDLSKRHAASLFYLPCQAKGGGSFFDICDGDLLDPLAVLNVVELPDTPTLKVSIGKAASDQSIQTSIDYYRAVGAGTGQRNKAFFDLGYILLKKGCSLSTIEEALEMADYDDSRRAKGQIASVIKSLESGRYGEVRG